MVLKKNGGVFQAFNFLHAAGLWKTSVCVFKLSVCIEDKKRRVPVFTNTHPMDVSCLLAASRHGVFNGSVKEKTEGLTICDAFKSPRGGQCECLMLW